MKSVLRKIIPNFFLKEPLYKVNNNDLHAAIKQLKKLPTATAVERAMDILSEKYECQRIVGAFMLWKLYESDPNKLWERKGHTHCTQLNYLLRLMLVRSGHLKDSDIKFGYSLVFYISPHQYLLVTINDKEVALDPWNYDLGASVGKYAVGFGMREWEVYS